MSGQLQPGETDLYTFTASAEQIAIFTFKDQISLKLLAPNGKRLKLDQNHSVKLFTNGTYTVKVVNQQVGSSYAFTVKINS